MVRATCRVAAILLDGLLTLCPRQAYHAHGRNILLASTLSFPTDIVVFKANLGTLL